MATGICRQALASNTLEVATGKSADAVGGTNAPKALKLVLFNSANPGVHWWRTSSEVFQEACRQLGMESEVIYMKRDRIAMLDKFRAMAQSPGKPDAVIFPDIRQNAVAMLELAETYNIKAFIYNAGLFDEGTIKKYGGPRDYFKNWLGQILPNDKQAGYDLAKILCRRAEELGFTNSSGGVPFICLNGPVADPAAVERLKGLRKAAFEIERIRILQIVNCDWTRDDGYLKTQVLVKRYPGARVIWSANDPMALGVLKALAENRIEPAKDVIVGSMDWDPEVLAAVGQGRIVASIDGHFMESAWAAILLYDYFNGKDFKDEALTFSSKMSVLDGENIKIYLECFKPENFGKINFSRFSKVRDPGLLKYNFMFGPVLEDVRGRDADRRGEGTPGAR